MNKQKKAIFIIFGIIIFVLCVFLGLGYLGQITGGKSLIQREKMSDKYFPDEITKYYPLENLNSKEKLLSDDNYAGAIQDALLSSDIEFEIGKCCMDKESAGSILRKKQKPYGKKIIFVIR